jgi:type IV pilus assembly protein PilY1
MKRLFCIAFFFLYMLGSPLYTHGAADMENYCQFPSSITNALDPNVLFVVDLSGSMQWCAYSDKGTSYPDYFSTVSCESTAAGYTYDASKRYEGYFDPDKYYTLNGSGVYIETAPPTGTPCTRICPTTTSCSSSQSSSKTGLCYKESPCSGTKKYNCCSGGWGQTGDCGLVDSGNFLNYKFMRRIDVLRWVLTGGKPESCTGGTNPTDKQCSLDTYPNSQLTTTCDSDGCILLGTNGTTKVKARWDRLTGADGGLLFQFKNYKVKPVIGTMLYQGTGISHWVRIGDFTSSNDYDSLNPYKNTISAMNYFSPGDKTPTAPALWDALNYFAQNGPQYGGPPAQGPGSDTWKNPLYRCINNDPTATSCGGSDIKLASCAKNFVILLTDGMWNTGGLPVVIDSCKIDNDQESQSPDPVVAAYYMHKTGFTNTAADPDVSTYIQSVYAIGLWTQGEGALAVKNIAMYGSFDRPGNTWPGGTTGFPMNSCSGGLTDCSGKPGKGSMCTPLPSPSHTDWDKKNNETGATVPDGVPDTFFTADDASKIKAAIGQAILEILRQVASGTAVSVLSSSEGSGANLLQALYFPRKSFGDAEIDWVGEMQNLWYYVDPFFSTSTIREDTDKTSGVSNVLNLADDYVLEFFYDEGDGKTKARRYSTDSKGGTKTPVDTVDIGEITNLWEAGKVLFERSSDRVIYTTTTGTTGSMIDFNGTNWSTLQPYLQTTGETETKSIINYIRGVDKSGYRNRTVKIGAATNEWVLGDIVDSSPRVQSSSPLNSFHKNPPDGYADASYYAFTHASNYLSRGMSYIGANDGMLHAFKHGTLEQSWTGKTTNDRARLYNSDTSTPLGSEVWAFVPKNALPYLRYLAEEDYCHLFYVDAPNTIIDASIVNTTADGEYSDDTKPADGSSWKTILIGGMGLGGASKIIGSSCTTGADGTCVQTPIKVTESGVQKGVGYSSYFALDVTTPATPALLWEFSDPELGYSTSGPAIVRIGNPSQNGKWFAVFASGPTGPVDKVNRQFLGKSDQNLKLFVVDLKTGTLVRTIDTGIMNAFGGSLNNATIDTERGTTTAGYYSDDVIYLGYTQCSDATCTSASTWTKGGVLRVITKENADPSQWVVSKVIEDIGTVTSAVVKLQDRAKRNLWLYFGTGRFYYRTGAVVDDSSGQRALYGIKEPCYNTLTGPENDIQNSCSSSVSSGLVNQSTAVSAISGTDTGWIIDLAAATGDIGAERVITDPLAVSSGSVFFTTYTPSTEFCSSGGYTNIWAVKYDTGGQVYLRGVAITQVSTGAIHEIKLDTAFTERGGRRTAAMIGMPPKGQGLALLLGPQPLKKILHMKER